MIEIGGNQRGRGLVNMVDGIERPNRAPTIFVELSKTHEAAHCPDETRRFFRFWTFLFNCCLQFIIVSRCLTHNIGSLSNLTRHRA